MPEHTSDPKLDQILEELCTVKEILTGNGDPEKGLVVKVDRIEQKLVPDADVRLDRLEQSETRRAWWARTALGAAVTALIGAAWAVLSGKSS